MAREGRHKQAQAHEEQYKTIGGATAPEKSGAAGPPDQDNDLAKCRCIRPRREAGTDAGNYRRLSSSVDQKSMPCALQPGHTVNVSYTYGRESEFGETKS
mmetsp:Transcript_12961/g.30473  ORF Transcript_12961/g.30473 Transcript_12961/m.30473 type:complete len:100 (-) Transcript_12961:987-1286(-)